MNKKELEVLESLLMRAENVILITEEDGEVHLSFSQSLSEMETLDILTMVTARFYEIADEGDNQIKH